MASMKITLINLDRSVDRLNRFTAMNGFLGGVERFAAVDGSTLNREELKKSGLLDPRVKYTNGALGCAFSHFSLWDRAVTEGAAVTVCEDDAVFNQGFEHQAARLLNGLPTDWDFVLWGWNFDSILLVDALPGVSPGLVCFDQPNMRKELSRFQALDFEPRGLRLLRAFGTICYSVTPGGAKKLLDACRPIRAMTVLIPGLAGPMFNQGLDVMCTAAYPKINAYVAFPPLVVSPNDHSGSLVQPR
jgi:glycosyl transferase, family 25